MTQLNIHCNYINKRIIDIEKSNNWNSQIINTSHEDFIRDFSANVFTNLIKNTFTKSYIKNFPCNDCGEPSTDRCHGIGEERPILLKKAIEKVWLDVKKPINIKKIIIAFLEEHKYSNFTFKCHKCHLLEKKTHKKN
jgi:hypothetical protein